MKVFSLDRSPEEIIRYQDLMRAVLVAGVNHPYMHRGQRATSLS